MKPFRISYVEIPAPNIEKSVNFYKNVFYWKIGKSDLSNVEYWGFSTGEGSIMGGLDPTKKVSTDGLLLYIHVDDIKQTSAVIVENGGKIVRDKFEIGGGFGYSATFKDPSGNTLGLWSEN